MELKLYGGPKHGGWSGHGEHQRGVDTPLKPCPFCGSEDIELNNTHTPFYAAQCNGCGAEGPTPCTGDAWSRRTGRAATERLHREAFYAAVRAWNRRTVSMEALDKARGALADIGTSADMTLAAARKKANRIYTETEV